MPSLQQTEPLSVIPQSPEDGLLIISPTIGRKISCYQTVHEMNLYLDKDDFINATDNFQEVRLRQDNDCEVGVIKMKNKLKKEIGAAKQIKIFRKNNNLFFKPVE